MEQFEYYKGYGIRYYELFGLTKIETNGIELKSFISKGINGVKLAKEYIDDRENKLNQY